MAHRPKPHHLALPVQDPNPMTCRIYCPLQPGQNVSHKWPASDGHCCDSLRPARAGATSDMKCGRGHASWVPMHANSSACSSWFRTHAACSVHSRLAGAVSACGLCPGLARMGTTRNAVLDQLDWMLWPLDLAYRGKQGSSMGPVQSVGLTLCFSSGLWTSPMPLIWPVGPYDFDILVLKAASSQPKCKGIPGWGFKGVQTECQPHHSLGFCWLHNLLCLPLMGQKAWQIFNPSFYYVHLKHAQNGPIKNHGGLSAPEALSGRCFGPNLLLLARRITSLLYLHGLCPESSSLEDNPHQLIENVFSRQKTRTLADLQSPTVRSPEG